MTGGFPEEAELAEISEALSEHYYGPQDLKERLQSYFESLEFSEEQINEVQSRLFEINRLKRKYGRSLEEILTSRKASGKKVRPAGTPPGIHAGASEADACKPTSNLKPQPEAASGAQTESAGAAEGKSRSICMISCFRMPGLSCLKEAKPSVHGMDEADFMISMNPGEPVRSLTQVASGGELSRLMLGIKTIFTRLEGIQTVIFDEIDTGVSGQVATAIGLKMSLLARDAQVFSVTHLAQVAACADQHYHVTKRQGQDFTETRIQCLSEEERIDQLALISQGELSQTARQAAQELYKRNQKSA